MFHAGQCGFVPEFSNVTIVPAVISSVLGVNPSSLIWMTDSPAVSCAEVKCASKRSITIAKKARLFIFPPSSYGYAVTFINIAVLTHIMPAAPKPSKTGSRDGPVERNSTKPTKTVAPKPIGVITHFFDKISVAVVKLYAGLKTGDKIRIEGHGNAFEQTVASMQIEHDKIAEAKKGQEVGMKVAKPVKQGDLVFKA